MPSPFRLWTNVPLKPDEEAWLASRAEGGEIVFAREDGASNLSSGQPDPSCRNADIAFGQPHPEDVLASTTLRWIHLTSAGYTRYDRPDVRQAVAARGLMTNSSRVYDDPCAQHVLAQMLAHERRLLPCWDSQKEGEWAFAPLRPVMRVLRGDRILMVGWGAIARRLAQLLQPFGVEIRGIKRRPEEPEVFPMADLDLHLPWADQVVNILPASPETQGVFHQGRFDLMKQGAVFYNVGRGDTVVQEDLAAALESGRLAAAYLDVTSPEPLPAGHFLWKAPSCFITPHLAGGMQNESQALLDCFVENLSAFLSGAEPKGRIM